MSANYQKASLEDVKIIFWMKLDLDIGGEAKGYVVFGRVFSSTLLLRASVFFLMFDFSLIPKYEPCVEPLPFSAETSCTVLQGPNPGSGNISTTLTADTLPYYTRKYKQGVGFLIRQTFVKMYIKRL